MIRTYTSLALVAVIAMMIFTSPISAQEADVDLDLDIQDPAQTDETWWRLQRQDDETTTDTLDDPSDEIWNTDLLFDPDRIDGIYVNLWIDENLMV